MILKITKLIVFLIFALFLFTFLVNTGCKEKKSRPFDDALEFIEKERKEAAKKNPNKAFSKENVAIVEACSQKYNSCIERCGNRNCENLCLKDLSICEKDLPKDLKTIK